MFSVVIFTSVAGKDAPVLCTEFTVLLAKDAIEHVPEYCPYFLYPRKVVGEG